MSVALGGPLEPEMLFQRKLVSATHALTHRCADTRVTDPIGRPHYIIEGQPVTWQQDGVQYVAVTSGYGGVYSLFSGDERLAQVPTGGSLWVFAVKKPQ